MCQTFTVYCAILLFELLFLRSSTHVRTRCTFVLIIQVTVEHEEYVYVVQRLERTGFDLRIVGIVSVKQLFKSLSERIRMAVIISTGVRGFIASRLGFACVPVGGAVQTTRVSNLASHSVVLGVTAVASVLLLRQLTRRLGVVTEQLLRLQNMPSMFEDASNTITAFDGAPGLPFREVGELFNAALDVTFRIAQRVCYGPIPSGLEGCALFVGQAGHRRKAH